MDFNRAERTCYRTNIPNASSGYQNGAFSYIVVPAIKMELFRTSTIVMPRLDSTLELCRAFPIVITYESPINLV